MITVTVMACPCGAPMAQVGQDETWDCTECDFTWAPRYGDVMTVWGAFKEWEDFKRKAADDNSALDAEGTCENS